MGRSWGLRAPRATQLKSPRGGKAQGPQGHGAKGPKCPKVRKGRAKDVTTNPRDVTANPPADRHRDVTTNFWV